MTKRGGKKPEGVFEEIGEVIDGAIDSFFSLFSPRHHRHHHRPFRIRLRFYGSTPHHTYGERFMQILKKEGAKVVVSAVDADGLDITVPTPVDWSVDGEFDVTPTADGLSAHVFPRGPTSVGTLKVVAGGLTVTADLSYTDLAPPERKAEKLNLTFTDIAPAPVMADTPPAAPPAVAGPAPDVDLP